MEIKVNDIVSATTHNPTRFSASQAECGETVARDTWEAAKTYRGFYLYPEQLEAWKEHVPEYGAWDEEELAKWSDSDFRALFIQFVSGDFRELQGICECYDYDVFNLTDEQFGEITQTTGGTLYPSGTDWFYSVGF